MMIEKEIVQHLNSGLSRKQVLEKMRGVDDDDEIIYHVNSYATLADKKKFMVLNLVLIGLLILVTGKSVYEIVLYGSMDMKGLAAMVIPAVNVYILKKLLYFHKNGYKFLFVLTLLSMVHKHNHYGIGLMISLALIALSGFLFFKFFRKENLLSEVNN